MCNILSYCTCVQTSTLGVHVCMYLGLKPILLKLPSTCPCILIEERNHVFFFMCTALLFCIQEYYTYMYCTHYVKCLLKYSMYMYNVCTMYSPVHVYMYTVQELSLRATCTCAVTV